MGRSKIKDNCAYWNTDKMIWEVPMLRPEGDRYTLQPMHIEIAHKMLSEQGIKFIEASYNIKNNKPMLLIANPKFWLANEADILEWLVNSNIKYWQNGMLLEFDNNEDKMMFMLRWS